MQGAFCLQLRILFQQSPAVSLEVSVLKGHWGMLVGSFAVSDIGLGYRVLEHAAKWAYSVDRASKHTRENYPKHENGLCIDYCPL